MGIRRLHGRELRQQFRDWPDAYALVEGQPVRFESLSVRSMNFGQDWRTPNVAEISYSLQLPMAFFLAFLDEPEQLADLVADTQQFPDRTNPLDNALLTAKPADAAAAMKELILAQELAGFFAHEAPPSMARRRRPGDRAPAMSSIRSTKSSSVRPGS